MTEIRSNGRVHGRQIFQHYVIGNIVSTCLPRMLWETGPKVDKRTLRLRRSKQEQVSFESLSRTERLNIVNLTKVDDKKVQDFFVCVTILEFFAIRLMLE